MQKLIFVIGATATGKTYFIDHNFNNDNYEIMNIYDYQQQAYNDAGFKDAIPIGAQFQCLYQANEMLLKDIIDQLLAGKNVVVEQTFYKAKRRISYIDEIRRKLDVEIFVYIMNPSDSRWKENIYKRKLDGRFERYKKDFAEIEFPNVSEGFAEIYEVVDGVINLKMEPANPEIVVKAHEELNAESKKLCKEDKEKENRRQLIESMKTRPFWHYCEICEKKEYITAQQAYDEGWDYPPTFGPFRMLFQRTCGECTMVNTLYMKVTKQQIPIVFEGTLTPKELKTWKRIKGEPESLLEREEENTNDI